MYTSFFYGRWPNLKVERVPSQIVEGPHQFLIYSKNWSADWMAPPPFQKSRFGCLIDFWSMLLSFYTLEPSRTKFRTFPKAVQSFGPRISFFDWVSYWKIRSQPVMGRYFLFPTGIILLVLGSVNHPFKTTSEAENGAQNLLLVGFLYSGWHIGRSTAELFLVTYGSPLISMTLV